MISTNLIYEQAYIKFGYDDFMWLQVKDFLDNLPKSDAIPVNFIKDFAEHRDPVYQNNIETMIKVYNREVPERDRIPEYRFIRAAD